MSVDWRRTSSVLPSDGEHVEFLLERRDLAMNGIYNRLTFVSRWSEYEAGAVREWRVLPPGADEARSETLPADALQPAARTAAPAQTSEPAA